MGILSVVHASNGANIEFAALSLLDLAAQRTTDPKLDDLMQVPYMRDRGDGVGQRVRPTKTFVVRAKVGTLDQNQEQVLDQVFDDPASKLVLTLYETDLYQAGMLYDGQILLKPDDRLLQVLYSDGVQAPAPPPPSRASEGASPYDVQTYSRVRFDWTIGGQPGLRCYSVRPGLTGTRLYYACFEAQRASQSGYGPG